MSFVEDAYAKYQAATLAAAQPFVSWAREAAGVGVPLSEQKALYSAAVQAREEYYTAAAQAMGGVRTSEGGGGEPQGKYTSTATRDASGAITGYVDTPRNNAPVNPYNPITEPGRYSNYKNANPESVAMPQQKAVVLASENPYQAITQAYVQNRPGYTPVENLGDPRTARIAASVDTAFSAVNRATGQKYGVTPENIRGAVIAMQLQEAQSKQDYRASQYFINELSKFAQNKVETSSEYHYVGKVADVPIPANPYEYQGDLAVEYLKGTPQQYKDVFSPASGQMARTLPFGGLGLQPYAWELAKANEKGALNKSYYNVDFRPATAQLIAAAGEYGPYATLYGGPSYAGTPSSEGLRKQEPTPFTPAIYDRIVSEMRNPVSGGGIVGSSVKANGVGAPVAAEGRLVGGNKVANVGTRIDATSPQNVEVLMAGGALPKPFRSGGAAVITDSNEFDSSRGFLQGFLPNISPEKLTAFREANKNQNVISVALGLAGGAIEYDKSAIAGAASQYSFGISDYVFPAQKYLVTPATPERTTESIRTEGDKTITTTTTIPGEPAVYKNQWELFTEGSGRVARAASGTSLGYLSAREQAVQNKPGIEGAYERIQYGAEKYILTEPANLAPAALQVATFVYGGAALGAIGRSVASGGGRLAPVAAALVSPTGRMLANVAVGTFFATGYTIGVTDKFQATPEQTQINVGSTLPALGVMWVAGGGADWTMNPRGTINTIRGSRATTTEPRATPPGRFEYNRGTLQSAPVIDDLAVAGAEAPPSMPDIRTNAELILARMEPKNMILESAGGTRYVATKSPIGRNAPLVMEEYWLPSGEHAVMGKKPATPKTTGIATDAMRADGRPTKSWEKIARTAPTKEPFVYNRGTLESAKPADTSVGGAGGSGEREILRGGIEKEIQLSDVEIRAQEREIIRRENLKERELYEKQRASKEREVQIQPESQRLAQISKERYGLVLGNERLKESMKETQSETQSQRELINQKENTRLTGFERIRLSVNERLVGKERLRETENINERQREIVTGRERVTEKETETVTETQREIIVPVIPPIRFGIPPLGGGGGGSGRTRKRRKVELFSFEMGEDSPIPTRFGLGGQVTAYVPGSRGIAADILSPKDIAPNRLFDIGRRSNEDRL